MIWILSIIFLIAPTAAMLIFKGPLAGFWTLGIIVVLEAFLVRQRGSSWLSALLFSALLTAAAFLIMLGTARVLISALQ